MFKKSKADVVIVGAGIVGLAHAYLTARSGKQAEVFERNPAAKGASIRNFGIVWPIGQPPGSLHQIALRSREIWIEAMEAAGLPYRATGSLHVVYRDDEATVAQEFSQKGPDLGYECSWLSTEEVLARSKALRPDGLLGALWSPTELTVDPRQVVALFPRFLTQEFGVQFHFNSAVIRVESGAVFTAGLCCEAETIIVAGGDDFQTLFPECFEDSALTRCKLQMMRTAPQPQGWQLGPSIAFGLTFNHYPTFGVCSGLGPLRERINREMPEFERWGIHVMVSETSAGELTIGDSHEYGLAVNIFDRPVVNRLILDFARRYLRVPTLEIAEQWHGVYAKHRDKPFLRARPKENVYVITVTSGIGMTMSFGLAEQTFRGEGW